MKESIILNNISSRLGIESINEIQKAMAENFSTNNIMLLSPTGSGKTLAFIIPVLKICVNQTAKYKLLQYPRHESLRFKHTKSSVKSHLTTK